MSLCQDEESESDDDEESEDWGSDSVHSGSESEDNEGAASSLALVFLKKYVDSRAGRDIELVGYIDS